MRRFGAAQLETLIVGFVLAVGVAGFGAATVRGVDHHAPPELLDWQVSAMADLTEADRAIFSALSVAAEDISWMNHDSGEWPAPQDLGDVYLIPPFLKDAFWEENGRVDWQLLSSADTSTDGATAYLGSGGRAPRQSAYLLVFDQRPQGATYSNQKEIWVNPDADAPPPGGYASRRLILAGWKRVVAHTGADESTMGGRQ